MRIAIAGGGTGIGAACALRLLDAGVDVIVAARTQADLEALAKAHAKQPRPRAKELKAAPGRLQTVACDLSTDAGAQAFSEASFRDATPDALLVCVGAAHPRTPLAETNETTLREQLSQHVVAAALTAGGFVKRWQATATRTGLGSGLGPQVLFLSSLTTRRPPIAGTGAYAIAKAALEELVRQLAEEAFPIRVNALRLGPVATRLHAIAGTPRDELACYPTAAEAAQSILQQLDQLAGRTGQFIDAEAHLLEPELALWAGGQLTFVNALQGEPGDAREPAPEAEPGRRPSPKVLRALRESAARVHRYPQDKPALLDRLAALHQRPARELVVSGAGATELLERSLRALCGHSDEVVSPFPTFDVLSALCSRLGLRHRPVPSPRTDDGLFGPLRAAPLLRAIGPRTRVIYVASPDNPTGATLSDAELTALLEGLPAGVALVLDEAWSLQVPAPTLTHDRLIRLRTFSKLFGLAGLRMGYALAGPTLATLLRRLELPYPLGVPQLAAALAVLDELPRAERAARLILRERGRVSQALTALGLSVSESPSPVLLVRGPRPGPGGARLAFSGRAAGLPVEEAHWDPAAVAVALGTRAQNRALIAAFRRALEA